jgi:hypothetical protein
MPVAVAALVQDRERMTPMAEPLKVQVAKQTNLYEGNPMDSNQIRAR